MNTRSTLALGAALHSELHAHLFPGDGLEAAAIVLCARCPGTMPRLVARRLIIVPHGSCRRREPDWVTWPGDYLDEATDMAKAEDLAVLLVHSHPGGNRKFSAVDDRSDGEVMPCLFAAGGDLHGSAIMTSDGEVRARLYTPAMERRDVGLVTVAGDDIRLWWANRDVAPTRRPTAFTPEMTSELGRLSAAVIGASGTGSVVVEQLARLGIGRLVLIDPDRLEHGNLNRIINASLADAEAGRLKVQVLAEAVERHRGRGIAVPVAASILTRNAVIAAAGCDVLFCCVDTLEARQVADRISASFLLPLFDVGVTIPARQTVNGIAITEVCGRIDYVQPGGSTLGDRGVYDPVRLRAEYLRRVSPEAHDAEVAAGYFQGAAVEAPSVVTLNMRAASACVNEFIARVYPFRLEANRSYARTRFSLAACDEDHEGEDDFPRAPAPDLGRGGLEPLLGLPILGQRPARAVP